MATDRALALRRATVESRIAAASEALAGEFQLELPAPARSKDHQVDELLKLEHSAGMLEAAVVKLRENKVKAKARTAELRALRARVEELTNGNQGGANNGADQKNQEAVPGGGTPVQEKG